MISIARLIRNVAVYGLLGVLTSCGGGLSGSALSASSLPTVRLSNTSLTPGWFPVGTRSESTNLFVTNSGNATLWISGVTLTGPNTSDFALYNGCPSSVAAGANCLITFTFTPTAPGTRTAYINIADNAPGSSQYGLQTVTIYGTGEGPTATLSKASLAFGSIALGNTSAAQTLTLRNSGNESLSISGLSLVGANPGDFTQSSNCGSSLAPGNTCTISVTFKPAAGGTFTAALALTDNAPGSPQGVSLSGTGGNASSSTTTVSVSPTSLAFGNQATGATSSSQAVTLKNTGSSYLTISKLALTGANPGDFTDNDNCNASVAPGTSCTIAIAFTPSAIGSASAAIQITDNSSASPQTVTLSGTGIHDVMLAWAAGSAASIAGYNVFRGTSPGGEGSAPLNAAPVKSTSYVDATVSAGVTYYYVIKAVSSNGATESAPSNEVSVGVP